MSNINNREYRLKIFREKIYNSTIKVSSNSQSNNIEINKSLNKTIKCPHCNNEEIIKYGSYNGKQRYKCKNDTCERTFTEQSESPFRHSKNLERSAKNIKGYLKKA